MADRPFEAPLPADLPEDWTSGQIVAPSGADAGLSEQHGYNYLMAQVNAAQRGVNAVNAAFDTISGKRTCRFVIGTSTAGWTKADCDYLCDGADDQVELKAAIEAAPEAGCEIVVLDGTYHFSAAFTLTLKKEAVSIVGNPGSTIIELSSLRVAATASTPKLSFLGISFRAASAGASNFACIGINLSVQQCEFDGVKVQIQDGVAHPDVILLARFSNNRVTGNSGNLLYVSGMNEGTFFHAENNTIIADGEATLFNFNLSNGSFLGNTLQCSSNDGMSQMSGGDLIADNVFSGVSLTVDASAGVVNNKIVNGILSLRGVTREESTPNVQLAASGNIINNGKINATGLCLVCGNVVYAGENDAAVWIYKDSANAVADLSPIICSNFLSCENLGVWLQAADFEIASTRNASHAFITGNRFRQVKTPVKIESTWSNCMITDNLFDGTVVDEGTSNIVRSNSDDTGSGGGGTAGVTSFNGRAGAVAPQTGDYTAAMVGAIPAGAAAAIQAMTQAEYDALTTKDPTTLYLIKE